MPRERQPPQTDVPRQIKIGLKIGVIALAVLTLVFMCLRAPLRRLSLRQPRLEAGALVTLPLPLDVIASGNLNGDEFTDLVLAFSDQARPRIDVVIGHAEGFDFERPMPLPQPFQPLDLTLGDLDGDGLDEILGTSGSGRATVVWWNRGAMRFERDSLRIPLRFVEVLDENRDGTPDVVGLRQNFSDILVHGVVEGALQEDPLVEEGVHDRSVRDFEAAHLDGSGMDVALVARNRIRLLRSGGLIPDITSYFNLPPVIFPAEQQSRVIPSLILGDLNDDGRPDLAYIDAEQVMVHLDLGGGNMVEAKHPVPGQPASRVVHGDFDGSGTTDLLTVSPDGTTIQFLWGH